MAPRRKHPELYDYEFLVTEVVENMRSDTNIADQIGCHQTDVTAARRAFGIIAARPPGKRSTVRDTEQIAHFLRNERCYVEKARKLMRGEK